MPVRVRDPERTVYRITEVGKIEMVEWTRELIADPQTEHPKFAAGLSVMAALPPAEVIAALQHRLDRLCASIEGRRASLDEAGKEVPRLFLVEEEYRLSISEAEATWVRSLLEGTHHGQLRGDRGLAILARNRRDAGQYRRVGGEGGHHRTDK